MSTQIIWKTSTGLVGVNVISHLQGEGLEPSAFQRMEYPELWLLFILTDHLLPDIIFTVP